MALINPEKIFNGLMSAMGVTPEIVTSFVTEIVTEVRTMRAERVAFKAACQQVVPDIIVRLKRVEDACERIDDMLRMIRLAVDPAYSTVPAEPAQLSNGVLHHVGTREPGHAPDAG